jgi:hypothetical protein
MPAIKKLSILRGKFEDLIFKFLISRISEKFRQLAHRLLYLQHVGCFNFFVDRIPAEGMFPLHHD